MIKDLYTIVSFQQRFCKDFRVILGISFQRLGNVLIVVTSGFCVVIGIVTMVLLGVKESFKNIISSYEGHGLIVGIIELVVLISVVFVIVIRCMVLL